MTLTKTRLTAFATLMAGTLLAGSALAQTEVKIGYALAVDSHYGVAANKWQEVVEAETDGRYTFTHFPSSGLGGEREVLEGLQIGTVEATIVSSGTLSNFVPEAGVFDIPFLFRNLEHARSVMDGEIGDDLLTKFEGAGLIAVAWGEQGFRHITNNRGAIEGPGDMAGLKLRTMENPIHITAFETLGAAPTPMAWPEVIGALQQGTIDGQENPLSVITSANLSEVQRHLTLSGHVYSPAMLLVSPDLWNGMSDEDKAVFTKGATEAVAAMRAFVDEVEESGVAELRDEGMEVGELSDEQKGEFQEALASAFEQYYNEYDRDLIEQIMAAE